MPLLTVCVPTYNRAHFLPYTLNCLQQQTFQDFEIVIYDNASTDQTPQIIRQFEDSRTRYYRQPSLVAPEQNWRACAEEARTDWIVYNQDDDILSPYFLERCAHAIRVAPEIVMYATEVTVSKDITTNCGAAFAGFPFRHHWDQPQPRLIPGVQIVALSWFVCPFSPPAQAMRKDLLLKHLPVTPELVVLGEHNFSARIASEGVVAVEAYHGAIVRNHAERSSNTNTELERPREEAMFAALGALLQETKMDWQSALREILPESPLPFRVALLDRYLFYENIAPEAMEILAATIAVEKGLPPESYLADLRAERLKPPPMGRLDRWKVPRPVTRVIRGLLYAAGKDM
jgi:glycosyltransferase involved in cell wall biosynthesis